jgi:superfamily II DNA or RNA helicase
MAMLSNPPPPVTLGHGGLRDALGGAKSFWWVPAEPVVDQVLVPALQNTSRFECMAGYFGGGVLRDLAHGLARYITRSGEPLKLLVGPVLNDSDREALRLGTAGREDLATEYMRMALTDEITLTSALAQHTLQCLAYLVAEDRLQLRVVLMPNGIFHPKQWIFIDGDDVAVLSGSANFTSSAVSSNVERLTLDCSWKGDKEECDDALDKFEGYWNNRFSDHAVSVSLSRALQEELLRSYGSGQMPSAADYERARRIEGLPPTRVDTDESPFYIPQSLSWEEGDFKHQGEAVHAWEAAARRGVFAMATGAGKTVTSLVCAQRLWQETQSLLVLVAVPTVTLVRQWTAEMAEFGLTPYSTLDGTASQHLEQLEKRLTYLEFGVSSIEAAVVSNDFIKRPETKALLGQKGARILLIGDEMHNLGTDAFIAKPPDVHYRIGLSATPERQYDEEGTERLFDYFGDVVYEFGLDKAIGLCLVPYQYHLHSVRLDEDEHFQYLELSAKIRAAYARSGGDDKPSSSTQRLMEKRRLVLESAHGKLDVLKRLLREQGPESIKYTLIHCTDKNRAQLLAVNELLSQLGIRFHQITAEESRKTELLKQTIGGFRAGHIQVLTAMRVLDEGFNVPEITTAFILASTTVRRQWVQRRGRILRLCSTIDKPSASIHDIIVLPPAGEAGDPDARRLVKAELERCDEFARLALNRDRREGPARLIQDLETEYVVWAER